MSEKTWEVEIVHDRLPRKSEREIEEMQIPVRFRDDLKSAVYGPADLLTIDDTLCIRTKHPIYGLLDHRELHAPRWRADGRGIFRVSGFESREDGTVVRSTWLIQPYDPEDAW